MSFGSATKNALEKEKIPVEEEEISTNREAEPLPYGAGTFKATARWIVEASNRITKQAPQQQQGKK